MTSVDLSSVRVIDLPFGSAPTGSERIYAIQNGTDVQLYVDQINPRSPSNTVPLSFRDAAYACGASDALSQIDAYAGLSAIMAWSIANQIPVTGLGATFSAGTPLTVPTNNAVPKSLAMSDVSLIDLNPTLSAPDPVTGLTGADSSARRFFTSYDNSKLRLARIKVNRNGDGTNGSQDNSAGMWFSGGSNNRFEDLEVTGGGQGHGIRVKSMSDSEVIRPYAHDMFYNKPTNTDDLLAGVTITYCVNTVLSFPTARNLTGNPTVDRQNKPITGYKPIYTRGICVQGTTDCQIMFARSAFCDQGQDDSGGDGNIGLTIIGGVYDDAYTYGLKLANSAVRCKVIGATVNRAGNAGIVLSGPSASGLSNKEMDVDLIGCIVTDTGYGGQWAGNGPTSIWVQTSGYDVSYPRGVRINNCHSRNTQATSTTAYGFRNQPAYTLGANQPNTLTGCTSSGHLIAMQSGFHEMKARVRGGNVGDTPNTISIPHANNTNFTFKVADFDPCGFLGTSDPTALPLEQGTWHVRATVTWPATGTPATPGSRLLDLVVNGNAVSSYQSRVSGQAVAHTQVIEGFVTAPAGFTSTLRLRGYQDSGASLATSIATVVLEFEQVGLA